MKDCPLKVSDWFAFFQNYIHERTTIALAKGTIFISLTIFLISSIYLSGLQEEIIGYLDSNVPIPYDVALKYIAIVIVTIFSIILLVYVLRTESNKCRLAREMIKMIIYGEDNSNIIRNEWEKRFKMFMKNRKSIFDRNIDYNRYANDFIIVGFIFLVIGLILIIISYFDFKASQFAATFFTGGLGIFSIGIAFHAVDISKKSDKKMKSIANVQFLQAVDKLEDVRAFFIGAIYKPDLFGWKTKHCIEMILELLKRDEEKKYIDPKYQDKLFHYFTISFKHLLKYTNWEKEKDAISRFIESYAMLDEYYNETRKKEFDEFYNNSLKDTIKDFYDRVNEFKKNLNEPER